jgi:hypothetical protein
MPHAVDNMDNFRCPYCFGHIKHDLVHFRSSRTITDATGILPDEYDPYDDGDVNRFMQRYTGPDKEQRLARLKEWKKFAPGEDKKYKEFWEAHGGRTTEVEDKRYKFSGVQNYNRPIINPSSREDRSFLKDQDGGGDVFVRDADHMVVRVEFKDGKGCSDRVCPHCHNPLPYEYGKYPIKFVSIIGITGSGKTVFLSQLLKGMDDYAVKVGLSADVRSAASRTFYQRENVIKAGVPLPTPTPVESFQQPLFYNLTRKENGRIRTDTFVLYDVAGEVFEDDGQELIQEFAPFIAHSDGLIMLVDPNELKAAQKLSDDEESMTSPKAVLNTVHSIVFHGKSDEQCSIPFAICITKTDMPLVQKMFPPELKDYLLDDVHEVLDASGRPRTAFNADEYAPIAKCLNEFIRTTEKAFDYTLNTSFQTYAFFGLTALGCEVSENRVPVGPILPKRIEEPLLWLFYQLGYIDKKGTYPLPNPKPIACPMCGHTDTREAVGDERFVTSGWGPFKKVAEVNRVCNECGHKWWHRDEQ